MLNVTSPSVVGRFEKSGAVAVVLARLEPKIEIIAPGARLVSCMNDAPLTTRIPGVSARKSCQLSKSTSESFFTLGLLRPILKPHFKRHEPQSTATSRMKAIATSRMALCDSLRKVIGCYDEPR